MRLPRGLLIGRARLQGALTGDAGAQRRRLTHLLDRVDARPPGRPPSAILLVRSLGLLPGGNELGPLSGPGAGRLEAALQSRLLESWAKAVRPQRGQVPPGAEAIWFLDEAEFLAFLALGRRERWWWEALPDPGGLFPLLSERPEALPGALLYLTEWAEAGRVLSQLCPPEARRLLDLLRATFRLPDGASSQTAWTSPAPWEPATLTPSLLQRLGPERGQLLRTAVAVLRAPAALRRLGAGAATGGQSVRSEQRAERPPEPVGRSPIGTDGAVADGVERLVPVEAALARSKPRSGGSPLPEQATPLAAHPRLAKTAPPEAEPLPADQPRADQPQVDQPSRITPGRPAHSQAAPLRPARSPAAPNGTDPPQPSPLEPSLLEPPPLEQTKPTAEPGARQGLAVASSDHAGTPAEGTEPPTAHGRPERDAAPQPPGLALAPDQPIRTGVGGVLYLLNLLAHHDLPERDQATWALAAGLGTSGLLRLIAGPLLPESERDTLWALLDELEGFEPDRPLGSEMVHPGSDPDDASVANTVQPWFDRAGEPLLTVLGQPLAAPLRAWMRLYLPPLLASLAAALGAPPDHWAPYLRLPARLWLTQTHLDLELSVDQIALPIRLAGLDANPGWVPALGRVVSFHFR